MIRLVNSRWLALPFGALIVAAVAVGARGGAVAQSSDDQNFVQQAYRGNLEEIREARRMLRRTDFDAASAPRVRSYAQMMIDDHSLAEVRLRIASRAAGVALPSPAPTGDDAMIDRSSGAMASPQPDDSPPPGGRGRAYFRRQADAHQAMLTLLNNEIAGSGSAALKQWASDMVPVVQKHLAAVQQFLDGTASPAPRSPDPASPVAPPPSPRGTPAVNITPTPMRSSSP